eukprot:TRINITY_DN2551_c0_g1_i2.p1 TRINITY_DN2551_c0_g1~~TRINITY_DN2551_c0_g1_i2.p1  ORF type:complete len:515 (+),score=117.18 TRINITY_DN2551_c0_g1_i2:142-1686(+)
MATKEMDSPLPTSCIFILSLICVFLVPFSSASIPSDPPVSVSWTVTSTHANSTLYTAKYSQPIPYHGSIKLLILRGTHYQMGYDYGMLLGKECKDVYETFLKHFLKSELEVLAFGVFLDWQWDTFLSKQIPGEFVDELRGFEMAGKETGIPDLHRYVARIVTLSNAPGDMEDFFYILAEEFEKWIHRHEGHTKNMLDGLSKCLGDYSTRKTRNQCSMFALWGNRTDGGRLWTMRNLDWYSNLGTGQFRMVTLFNPTDGNGRIPHMSIGFVGMIGALAGMSEKGLTVHEANLEEKAETFDGFPFALRLRYVMEYASNIDEAVEIWERTNNTCGFNHMFGSAEDGKALVLETMEGYTAYFGPNDPRESSAMYRDAKTNQTKHLGSPMGDAIYRTNHGYDPTIRETYLWPPGDPEFDDSVLRYFILVDALKQYEKDDEKIGLQDAMYLTRLIGQKGADYYSCPNAAEGENILSMVFDPKGKTVYAGWEDGEGEEWRPACCNPFIQLSMVELQKLPWA